MPAAASTAWRRPSSVAVRSTMAVSTPGVTVSSAAAAAKASNSGRSIIGSVPWFRSLSAEHRTAGGVTGPAGVRGGLMCVVSGKRVNGQIANLVQVGVRWVASRWRVTHAVGYRMTTSPLLPEPS